MGITPVLKRETILIVDNEPEIGRLMSQALGQEGYNVLLTGNGNAAIQIAEKHQGPIHLLISEILIPGMSGLELVPKIVARYPPIGVLYISDSDLIVRAFRKDLDLPFLPKPFSMEAFINTVGIMLFALKQKHKADKESNLASSQPEPTT